MICGWIQWFNYSHPFVKAYRWVCWEIFSEKAFIFPLVMSIVFFVSSPSCSFNIFVVKSLNRPQISMPPILLKRTEAKWRGFPLPRPMSKNEECSSMLEQSLNNKSNFLIDKLVSSPKWPCELKQASLAASPGFIQCFFTSLTAPSISLAVFSYSGVFSTTMISKFIFWWKCRQQMNTPYRVFIYGIIHLSPEKILQVALLLPFPGYSAENCHSYSYSVDSVVKSQS